MTIKIGNQNIALKKNHPAALRPLLFAIKAPIVPGITQIIRIIISSGIPIPNMLLFSFHNEKVTGSRIYRRSGVPPGWAAFLTSKDASSRDAVNLCFK